MKHRMLQRACALVLAAALSATAFAADTTADRPAERKSPASVSWSELRRRVRAGNLTAQAVIQQIEQVESIDYQRMEDELRDGMNKISAQQFAMIGGEASSGGGLSGSVPPGPPVDAVAQAKADAALAAAMLAARAAGEIGAQALQSQYSAMRKTFDDLKKGELQKDNADLVRQMEDGLNQIIAGCETLYITIVGMENARKDALRGVDTLERSLAELRLRRELGQVSQQTVDNLEQKKSDVLNQIDALDDSITTCKMQLQVLMGEEPTGKLTVTALPVVTDEQLEKMEAAGDLERAKKASVALLNAQKTLDDAKKTWDEAKLKYSPASYNYMMSEHTWNAARLTYEAEVQSFETSFNTLFRTVKTDRQTLAGKARAASHAASELRIAQIKFDRGLISKNKLLEVRDAYESADSERAAARRQLFQDYAAYTNAVDFGVLNQNRGGTQ